MQQKLTAKATLQIQQPASKVFEAIVNPELMRHYFIAQGTGRLTEGATVQWSFPEFPGQFPVRAIRLLPDSFISFDWSGGREGMLVEIRLEEQADQSTVVRVMEKEMNADEEGIAWVIGQTEGWANFLACMKAFLDHGIHLRQGAFDFMKQPV